MEVKIQNGEDGQSRRFQLDFTISQRERKYGDATEALLSPVASKIFGFPWTQSVTVGPDFVTVVKQDWVDWSILEDPLSGLIKEHFAGNGSGPVEENSEPAAPAPKIEASSETEVIQQLIEDHINPALANHGGYVVLHGVKENQVYLEMGGGCQGCAMSYQTLKEGIETSIKGAIPSIESVIDVTRHDEGQNPFYAK